MPTAVSGPYFRQRPRVTLTVTATASRLHGDRSARRAQRPAPATATARVARLRQSDADADPERPLDQRRHGGRGHRRGDDDLYVHRDPVEPVRDVDRGIRHHSPVPQLPVRPAPGATDYVTTSGTLTFGVGVTTQTIAVTVCRDATFEIGRDVQRQPVYARRTRRSSTRAASARSRTTTPRPTFSIDDVTAAEGSPSGTSTFTFTVTKSGRDRTQLDRRLRDGSRHRHRRRDLRAGDRLPSPHPAPLTFAAGVDDADDRRDRLSRRRVRSRRDLHRRACRARPTPRSPMAAASARSRTTIRRPASRSTTSARPRAPGGTTTPFTFTVTKTGSTALTSTVAFTTNPGTATGAAACAAGVRLPDAVRHADLHRGDDDSDDHRPRLPRRRVRGQRREYSHHISRPWTSRCMDNFSRLASVSAVYMHWWHWDFSSSTTALAD